MAITNLSNLKIDNIQAPSENEEALDVIDTEVTQSVQPTNGNLKTDLERELSDIKSSQVEPGLPTFDIKPATSNEPLDDFDRLSGDTFKEEPRQLDEEMIQRFIQYNKSQGRSKEEAKIAYNNALNDGIFDIKTRETVTVEPVEVKEGLSGFDIGVKTGEDISGFGKKFKFESNIDDGIVESGAKFLANLPGDTVELGGELITALSDPLGTAKGVKELAGTGIEAGLNKIFGKDAYTSEERRMLADTVGDELEKLGEPGAIKALLTENPADVLTSVFSGVTTVKNIAKTKGLTTTVEKLEKLENIVNPIKIQADAIKGTGKAIKGAVKGLGEGTTAIIGKTTGAGSEAIKAAFENGGKESFAKALRGEITDEDILNSAKKAFDTIKEQRADVYGEDYAKLIENKTPLGTDDIKSQVITLLDDSKVKIIPNETDGFRLDFGDSTITQKASQSQIKEMFNDVMYWADDTAEGLDVLKQRVQDRWLGGEGTGKADRLSTALSNTIKSKISKEIPEYADMVGNYEKLTKELKDINNVLRVGDEKSKMTAITRLGQTFKDNISFRKEMVEKLEELSGIDLKSSIAGASLKNIAPKGLVGAIAPTGIGYGAGAGLLTPTVIPLILGSSPRFIGELARAIGVSKEVLKKGLNNAKTLINKSSE